MKHHSLVAINQIHLTFIIVGKQPLIRHQLYDPIIIMCADKYIGDNGL